ncbi:MAG: type II toxin-antitoxin system VapC family toxin [Spirochaetia bacterium]|jgi:predicted nucleic acid-binding protein|nr:type II toxin-antitoxin system VapC family toxin [Spirochaetia bacterium]
MISVIDTNILLDIFLPDPVHGESSLKLLETVYQQGSLVICDIVYSELSPQFDEKKLLDESLEKIGISIISPNTDTLYMAGQLWLQYRKKQKSRDRIIPDFIVGSFAMNQGDKLITRDRGFYRDYFKGLRLN